MKQLKGLAELWTPTPTEMVPIWLCMPTIGANLLQISGRLLKQHLRAYPFAHSRLRCIDSILKEDNGVKVDKARVFVVVSKPVIIYRPYVSEIRT